MKQAGSLTILGCMLTTNNVDVIGLSLPSLIDACDDVVVVDGGSTDGTVERAHGSGARVIVRPLSHLAQQRQAYVQAALDWYGDSDTWLIVLDSDEILDMPNPKETAQDLENAGLDHLWIPRLWLVSMDGRTQYISSRPHYPDYQLRLFKLNPNVEHAGVVHHSVLGLGKGLHRRDVGRIWHLDGLVRTYEARAARVAQYRRIARRYAMPRYYLFEDYAVVLRPVDPDLLRPNRPLASLSDAPVASIRASSNLVRLRYCVALPQVMVWQNIYPLLGRAKRLFFGAVKTFIHG